MQEQNFEKQVREKMDELSFVPSAPVWEKVEEQIRRKKERRRLIFWLLPIFIGIGLGWWMVKEKGFTPQLKKEQTTTQYKNNKQDGTTPGNDITSTEKATGSSSKTGTNDDTIKTNNNTKTITANKKYKRQRATPIHPDGNIHSSHFNPSQLKQESEQLTAFEQEIDQEVVLPTFQTIIHSFNADSIATSRMISFNEIPDILKDARKVPETTRQSKWQLMLAFQGGISGLSEDFIRFGTNADMLYYASPAISVGGNFGNTAIPPPSKPKPGVAFSAGVDAKRKLSNRLAVVSGLRYAYYSTSMKVGSTVYRDTLIGRFDATAFRTESFYRNDGSQKDYTNQFHYIQVPVGFEFNLIRKLPLNIQTGVKFEQLLSSNALFYNQSASVYVNDKQMLTKTAVNLFGGFSYHFRSQKGLSFAVGPKVQYSLTNVSKNKANTQHLYFIGVLTQIYLKK